MKQRVKNMQRMCVVCGKHIVVAVNRKTRAYQGGHYFGRLLARHWWQRQRKHGYWECEGCYR